MSKKIFSSVLALSALATPAFSDSSDSPTYTPSGYYFGVSANATSLGSHKTSVSQGATILNTGAVDKTSKEKIGIGGSIFAGNEVSISQNISISPEIGLEMDNSKTQYKLYDGTDEYFSYLKKKIGAYLRATFSYGLTESLDLQVPVSIKYARFSYEGRDAQLSVGAPVYTSKKNINALGLSLGVGMEKKFETFALGAILSHAIYQSSKVKVQADNTEFSTKLPSETQLSIRLRVPFASL